MKLKRDLTNGEIVSLDEVFTALKRALSTTSGHFAESQKLTARMAEMDRLHAGLENGAAGGDLEASQKLQAVFDQKRRISEATAAVAAGASLDMIELRDRVNDAQDLVGRICTKHFEEQLAEGLSEALAPFMADPLRRRRLLSATDAYGELGRFFNAPLSDRIEELVSLGERYLGAIEHLRKKEDVWSYPATITSSGPGRSAKQAKEAAVPA